MSFSFSDTGTRDELKERVAKAYAPSTIKLFILEALGACVPDELILVSGSGHLDDSGRQTDVSLTVRPLTTDEKVSAGYTKRWVK